jgi:hypothetical protein
LWIVLKKEIPVTSAVVMTRGLQEYRGHCKQQETSGRKTNELGSVRVTLRRVRANIVAVENQ